MFGIVIFIALIKIYQLTHRVFLCAGIDAATMMLFNLLGGSPVIELLLWGVFDFAYASLFFFLLGRFEDSLFKWWLTIFGFLFGPPLFGLLTG